MAIALIGGGILDIAFSIGGGSTGNAFLGVIIGVVPGVLLAFLSRRAGQDGLGQGLLTGACVVTLIGGYCGGLLAGVHFR